MGNSNCCSGSKKVGMESINPSLQLIREAQQKYFNSQIDDSREGSYDEGDERDDSVDMYGSESSIDLLDDGSFDGGSVQGPAPLSDSLDAPLLQMKRMGSSDSILANGKKNSLTNSPVISAATTPIVTATNTKGANNSTGTKTSSTTAITKGTATMTHSAIVNEAPQNGLVVEGTSTIRKKKVARRKNRDKFIRLSKRANFYSIYNHEDKKARSVDPRKYQYPFENLVFEGGGNKGLAYCGAVRLLEELGIWPQIKCLSGTSAGAMTAALLAVGYNSYDLEAFFSLNLNKIFLDHRFGYLSLLPNLLTGYGWNPGNKIYSWFGQKMYDKMEDADVTFREVYEKCGRELCVVVTNLNQMTSLYCHPKTTPDMPVRLAVRMSLSIPGMFKAVQYKVHGSLDVFVDGGVLCNYPIHCFDGWWLSMKSEDNFLERLQPLEAIPRLLERSERFGTFNEKTLGMQLYSDNEQDLLKYQLENLRHGVELQELPNTKLAREKIRKNKLQLKTDREHRRLVKAMNAFLKTLRKHNMDKDENIDRDELEAALNDEESFPRKRRLILFGEVTSDIILDYLDRDHNGQISFNELVHFMEETGISMQNRFLGYQRRCINNFPMFLDTLQTTLLTNVKRVYVEERDLKRTVGINTGHIGTSDFVLEPADVEFVLERGRRSLEAFLKYYVASHKLKKKPEFRRITDASRSESKASFLSAIETPPSVHEGGFDGASNSLGIPFVDDPETSANNSNDENALVEESLKIRSKSRSSSKSVSISDVIDIIAARDRKLLLAQGNDDDDDDDDGEENEDDKMALIITEGRKVSFSDDLNASIIPNGSEHHSDLHLPTTPLLSEDDAADGVFFTSKIKAK